jgi:hypothetical protein
VRLFLGGVATFEFTTIAIFWSRWDKYFAIAATLIVLLFDVYTHKVPSFHGRLPLAQPYKTAGSGSCSLCLLCAADSPLPRARYWATV